MNQMQNKNMIEALTEELKSALASVQGLLVLAQYHQSRTEVNTYLGLISACIEKAEDAIRKSINSIGQGETKSTSDL